MHGGEIGRCEWAKNGRRLEKEISGDIIIIIIIIHIIINIFNVTQITKLLQGPHMYRKIREDIAL